VTSIIDPAGLADADRSHTGMNSVEALGFALDVLRARRNRAMNEVTVFRYGSAIETLTALRDMIAEGPRKDAR
jgi:hypothetical protein